MTHALTGSVLFITYNRAFIQRLATCIVELDRVRLTSRQGNHRNYLVLNPDPKLISPKNPH